MEKENGSDGLSTESIQPQNEESLAQDTKMAAAGFTEDGWFLIKIHESNGFFKILGYLLNAQEIVKTYFMHKQQKTMEEMKKKSLLRPPNGFRPSFFKKRPN